MACRNHQRKHPLTPVEPQAVGNKGVAGRNGGRRGHRIAHRHDFHVHTPGQAAPGPAQGRPPRRIPRGSPAHRLAPARHPRAGGLHPQHHGHPVGFPVSRPGHGVQRRHGNHHRLAHIGLGGRAAFRKAIRGGGTLQPVGAVAHRRRRHDFRGADRLGRRHRAGRSRVPGHRCGPHRNRRHHHPHYPAPQRLHIGLQPPGRRLCRKRRQSSGRTAHRGGNFRGACVV